MHLPRCLRMLGRIQHDRTGIEEAQVELRRTQRQLEDVRGMAGDFAQMKRKASQLRERNGFEELMTGLFEQGRTRPHGNGHSS